MAKDARITVRLDQRTLDKAKAVARKARRTVCDWTRITIEEAVRGSRQKAEEIKEGAQ